MALHQQHVRQDDIARRTGLSVRTIRRWTRTSSFPARQPRRPQASHLDPYKAYIVERWNAGCCNGSQLYRELQTQGYTGKAGTVLGYCRLLRQAQGLWHERQPPRADLPRAVQRRPPPTVNGAAWLIIRPHAHLTAEEEQQRQQLASVHPEVTTAIRLAESFLTMVRERQGDQLTGWLTQAAASPLRPFQGFAASLQRDLAAVQAGLTLAWSTGPVEGHINRLKMLKRHMYGRAKLDVLTRRLFAT